MARMLTIFRRPVDHFVHGQLKIFRPHHFHLIRIAHPVTRQFPDIPAGEFQAPATIGKKSQALIGMPLLFGDEPSRFSRENQDCESTLASGKYFVRLGRFFPSTRPIPNHVFQDHFQGGPVLGPIEISKLLSRELPTNASSLAAQPTRLPPKQDRAPLPNSLSIGNSIPAAPRCGILFPGPGQWFDVR